LNIVALKGNLVRDPELKYTPSGAAVCEIGIAVNEVWHDANKQKQERVHFFGAVAWGATGENMAKYFTKGMPILIEGSLTQETWEDKESGKKREKTKIKIARWDFCGGDRKEGASTTAAPAARPKVAADPDLDPADDGQDIPF